MLFLAQRCYINVTAGEFSSYKCSKTIGSFTIIGVQDCSDALGIKLDAEFFIFRMQNRGII